MSDGRFQGVLERVTAAGTVLILRGNTSDVFLGPDGAPSRLPHVLAKHAALEGRATVVFSVGHGTRQLTPPGRPAAPLHLPNADAPPAQAIQHLLGQLDTSPVPVQLVLDYADLSVLPAHGATTPDTSSVIELVADFALDPANTASGHRLVLLARVGTMDERLGRLPGFTTIDLGLPGRHERLQLIERLLSPASGVPLHLAPGMTAAQLAATSGGLTLDDLFRGRDETVATGGIDAAWVQDRKSARLRQLVGDSLIVYERGRGLADVAGLPQLRLLVREVRQTGQTPRRILLAGPPGVGKTLVVTALADELGIPAVALGSFRSMWVGESERNLRRVLDAVLALAPCVLHIDEIDQSVGQRTSGQSADGGTSERILADLWGFLGDNTHTERVTVVATTNRPELLDPAMFDRFTIVPVLHPVPAESAQIMRIAAAREGRELAEEGALHAVESYGELVTGRVLVDVAERAAVLAHLDSSPTIIGPTHLMQAFDDLLMALDPLRHEALALKAIELCTFRSFLPWNAARSLGEEPHLPAYLRPLLNAGGDVDANLLRARLRQLTGGDER
ncbi:MAG: ATP-binding protein [Chloroflexota bacterium]